MGWQDAPVIEITIPGGKDKSVAGRWQDAPVVQQGGDAQPLGEFGQSHAGQAISGVNEGIANILGFPAEAANTVIGAGMSGVNALAGTDFKPSPKPFLGQEMFRDIISPTIAPETDDQGKQVARRIGQEVGATIVPGAGLASRAARPMATIGAEIGTALSSGAGAAAAQQMFPDNPVAETIGSLAGGFAPMTIAGAFRRRGVQNAAPDADELQAQKNAAYQTADSLGVRYRPEAVLGMTTAVGRAARNANISPTRHPKAFSFIEDMQQRGPRDYSLTELDQIRQEVRRDLLRAPDESERHFGSIILERIDDFIARAGPNAVSSGDAAQGNQAILAARELNTRWRKTEMIEDALYAANLRAQSSGSGGNVNNTIRQAFRSILTNPRRRAGFSADEIQQMERVVDQGIGENALRLIGKLSPQGNGLMLALGIGGTAINPAMAGFSAAGAVAKALADRGTVNRANALRANVARGTGPRPHVPLYNAQDADVAQALLMGQAANQNDPGGISAALLRPRALN